MTSPAVRWTAWILIAGAVCFFTGAAFWRLRFQQPVPQMLAAVHGSRFQWMWIHGWMILGVALTTAGLAALRELLRDSGDRVLGSVSLALYLVGAALWIASLAFRLTATMWTAERFAQSATVPEWFAPLHQWNGLLFATHMVLSYLSNAALGLAILATPLLPRWLGYGGLVGGLSFAVGFGAFGGGPFSPPFLVHVLTLIAGIILAVR